MSVTDPANRGDPGWAVLCSPSDGDAEVRSAWCESAGVASIADVKPLHVAAYIEQLGRERSAPTFKPSIRLNLNKLTQKSTRLTPGCGRYRPPRTHKRQTKR